MCIYIYIYIYIYMTCIALEARLEPAPEPALRGPRLRNSRSFMFIEAV